MMHILEKIREWFEGEPESEHKELYNQGQQQYKSQSVPVDVQAQETEIRLQAIPVSVDGIIPVWSLPSKIQVFKTTGIYGTVPQPLINGSYKIKRLTLIAPFWGFSVGTEEDMKQPGYGYAAVLPEGFPTIIEGLTEDLWFAQSQASITANQEAPLSYIVEYWAD